MTPRLSSALAALVCLFACLPSPAQSPEDIFARGNEAYEQGRFVDAVEAYRGLLRYDVRDPRVEFNLGNAEFRVGNLGLAILHYQRARRLDPVDPDINANLEFVQSLCFDRVEVPQQTAVVQWVRGGQSRLGPDRQAWIVLALTWLIAALIAWCTARPAGWSAGHGWSLAALLLVTTIAASSWYVTLQRIEGHPSVVVLDEVVEVLAGPGYNNPALFTVHEGLTLEIRSERDEWLQVSLPNGLHGWVARESVGEV